MIDTPALCDDAERFVGAIVGDGKNLRRFAQSFELRYIERLVQINYGHANPL